jgi:hypothetical protein
MDNATEQGAAMMAAPQTENHRWLMQLVGEWQFSGQSQKGPDQPPEKWDGVEVVRALGELWIQGTICGDMAGCGETEMQMTLGYDPAQECFVGTFVATMMPMLWIYTGHLDAARKVLTLECDGPDMSGGGGSAKYRDIIELPGDGTRLLRSTMLGPDGQWVEFMRCTYTRVK